MFTDIVGYTALMQGDEAMAAQVRKRHRAVFQQQHEVAHGEIVQYYGDGSLSVFKSAIEAVECAIAIQKSLQEGNPVPLRIGLHMGDIVFDNTEVYGDGVNFAARIESMSVAGAILLSGKIDDELKNHPNITTTFLGQFDLKNIAKPVEVFAVTNEGIVVPAVSELKGKRATVSKTIAVLPFVNMSTNADNEYFSDGITEEIINALAKINSLKVTSRTSSFFFKNKTIPIKEIASELGVSAILEGSVRLAGNTLRITAQLIQAEQDFHFWSETWDRKLENIFEIQDEISLIIADKLREQFGHFEIQPQLVEKQTDNIDAYELSLKAKFHANKWNPEDMRMAISFYEQALELDPAHTESYLGLADAYGFMATTGFIPEAEAWGKAFELTTKARQLNEQLPEVHYQLANLAFFTAGDFKEAFKETQKAIEINPNYVQAQQFMSFLHVVSGNAEHASNHLEIALSIDPLSQETLFFKAYFHYMTRDYDKSLELLENCLQQNPKNIPAHTIKCYCLLKLGRFDAVYSYFDNLPADIVIPGDKLGLAALTATLQKDTDAASRYLVQLLKNAQQPNGFREYSYLFLVYALGGENDKAFDWLSDAEEKRSPFRFMHFADPLASSIMDDPRYAEFQEILFTKDHADEGTQSKKALLDEASVSTFSDRLLRHIRDEKPYLDPELSLRSLAGQIGIHANQLSWLLNNSIGKNFSEFINHYRVQAFKRISKDPKNAGFTIVALAYECGFNSKTVFNTYFKRETGLTPKQFLKQQ